MKRIYISETVALEHIEREQSFFLFSNGEIAQSSGDVYVFFSQLRLLSHKGRIFAFFSDVDAQGGEEEIYALSSRVTRPQGSPPPGFIAAPLSGDAVLSVLRVSEQDGRVVFDSTIPAFVINILLSAAVAAAVFLIAPLKRGFFEQGAFAVMRETFAVFRNGLCLYLIVISLAAVFLFSVVGFPVALLLAFALAGVALLGEISLAIALGYIILKDYTDKINTYSNLLVGVIIIEMCKNIPVIGNALSLFVIPAAALGLVCKCLLNRLYYKKFYDVPYGVCEERGVNKARAILTGSRVISDD
ncbi:MAG: hypothetical protein LBS62_03500 [Clostridiales bacterium]|nr:hypothetical protein [Clostridiales bacterium]